eukprot:TRINITY_DN305_c0_g1_i3.p2 TRINITY_DN305_c0_g1~~TRINITY_DN305_c0_g1_i3.p2  ORF type:complete len:105 (+),score=3.88 TRINITY_DN305_c0_g1_i3:607-921(+)
MLLVAANRCSRSVAMPEAIKQERSKLMRADQGLDSWAVCPARRKLQSLHVSRCSSAFHAKAATESLRTSCMQGWASGMPVLWTKDGAFGRQVEEAAGLLLPKQG